MLGSRYVMVQSNELFYVRALPKLQRQSFSTRFVDARVQLQQWRGEILANSLIFMYSNSNTVLVIKSLLYYIQLHAHTSTEVRCRKNLEFEQEDHQTQENNCLRIS